MFFKLVVFVIGVGVSYEYGLLFGGMFRNMIVGCFDFRFDVNCLVGGFE